MPDLGRTLPLAIAVLLQTAAPAAAQGDRSALWSQLLLSGELVDVSYAPGALDRATRVQQRFAALAQDVGGWSGAKSRLVVHLVEREDWDGAGLALPYGFPARLTSGLLALAAWGDEGTAELWRGYLAGNLPAVERAFERGSPEAAGSLDACDALGLVEGARILLEQAGLAGEEIWISELLAHTAALAVRRRHDPAAAARAESLHLAMTGTAGTALSLADYRSGISIEDWLAFQAAFHRGARELVEVRGTGAGKKIVRAARKDGGRLSARELLRRFPELRGWLQAAFAGVAAPVREGGG